VYKRQRGLGDVYKRQILERLLEKAGIYFEILSQPCSGF
jgi:hypothetical protein